MFIIQNLSYHHSNGNVLFSNLNLNVQPGAKVSLLGNNGIGKSTLLQIIAGKREPIEGSVKWEATPFYVPQQFGQYDELPIAEVMSVSEKIDALHEILTGSTEQKNYDLLNNDWQIEERCAEALKQWHLNGIDLKQKMKTLSGGQKTKVLLAAVSLHEPELLLLDEPSNHLDHESRELLYSFIRQTAKTLVVVSHDRTLLNLIDTTCELTKNTIKVYGGNYDFYTQQKQLETQAKRQDLQNIEKALKKVRETERETRERQQKLDSRGKAKQEKSGVARIMMNTLRNKAENTSSKLKNVHAEKTENLREELQHLRAALPVSERMKMEFDASPLHTEKILFSAENINFQYENGRNIWSHNLHLQIISGERIAIKGKNGSGKTTLLKIILGVLQPERGKVYRAKIDSVYIDQEYSLIVPHLTLYEQAQKYNSSALPEHEVKTRLNRFLFGKDRWDNLCSSLSGGERMRLILCCLNLGTKAPDLIVLDEPTNNLDIQSTEILTAAINEYQGTVIAISHDETFLKTIKISRNIEV